MTIYTIIICFVVADGLDGLLSIFELLKKWEIEEKEAQRNPREWNG